MIGRIRYASCYAYSPCGADARSERSRRLCELLKTRDGQFLGKYATRVRQQVSDASPLRDFIESDDVLVPIPGSHPRVDWTSCVAWQLSSALLNQGLGHSVWPVLRRVHAVQKSSRALPGSRPTVGCHYESFAVDPTLAPPDPSPHIVLVDDVVTKGRTLLAAAARIQDAFPDARIRAFALIRTTGFVPGVGKLLDPCVGEIKWQSGDASRRP